MTTIRVVTSAMCSSQDGAPRGITLATDQVGACLEHGLTLAVNPFQARIGSNRDGGLIHGL